MVKKVILFVFLLFLVTSIHAQPPDDPYDPGGGGCEPDDGDCDDEDVPLDNGVTYLLIAGIIYGVTRLNKNLKSQLAEDGLN